MAGVLRLKLRLGLTLALAAAASPLAANPQSVAYFTQARPAALPQLLSSDDRLYYASLFEAIDARNWDRVELMLSQRSEGPLHGAALAEYYLHPDSPRIDLGRLSAWLDSYGSTPQAEGIARLAATRGLTSTPSMPLQTQLVGQRGITRRTLPRGISDGSMPGDISSAILDRIKNDDPDGARLLLDGIDASLSTEARAEWRERIAWSYYIENRDAEALGMAQTVSQG